MTIATERLHPGPRVTWNPRFPMPVFDKDENGNEIPPKNEPKDPPKDDAAKLTAELEAARKKIADAEKAAADAAAAKQAADDRLKEFEGLDAKTAKELLAAQKKAEKDALEKAGEFDRLKAMMADEHKKELDAVKKNAEDANSALAGALKQINELTIGNSFAQSDFITKETVLTPAKARLIYGPNFTVENGVIVAYDKPATETGKTKLVDGSGNPLSFEAALKHLVEKDPERDKLKAATVKQGAGSKTDDTGKKTVGAIPEGTGLRRIEAGVGNLLKGVVK